MNPKTVSMLVDNFDDSQTAEYEAGFNEETFEEGLPEEAKAAQS